MPWALVDDTHGRYFANNKTYFDDAEEERSMKKSLPYLGLFALPVDLNTSKVSKPKVVRFLYIKIFDKCKNRLVIDGLYSLIYM